MTPDGHEAAVERLAERVERLITATQELADEVRNTARAEAAEVTTIMNADAHLEARAASRRGWFRVAAGTVVGSVFTAMVVDLHTHRHLSTDTLPLFPVEHQNGAFPIGLAFLFGGLTLALLLMWLGREPDR